MNEKKADPTWDEVEQKVSRENLRYRRWGWLSWLGRLLNFGTIIRPGSVGSPEDQGEAPMAELERLAKFGIRDEAIGAQLEYEDVRRVMLLCNAIATTGGVVNEANTAIALGWALELGPQEMTDGQREELAAAFQAGAKNPQQLRNEAFHLRNRVPAAFRVKIVEVLYRLALAGGSNSKALGRVTDIGERLDLKTHEIWLALVSARKASGAGFAESATTAV